MENAENIKMRIGASLLGQSVRHNGGHQLDPFLKDTREKFVDYVPVCPDAECGFAVPREAFRPVGKPDRPRFQLRNPL